MRRLFVFPLLLSAAAGAALVAAGLAAAAAAAPPRPGPAAVSVQDCTATGGMPLPDGQGRYWCVGGVYTGVRIG